MVCTTHSEELVRRCQERGIDRFVHFTRCERLDSILRWGLLPQSFLLHAGQEVEDFNRNDGHPENVCLSVQWTNKVMFKRKRNDSPRTDWCVIELSPAVIADFETLFFPTNAARTGIIGTPGADGFEAMFAEQVLDWTRPEHRCSWLTTDKQAEVQVYPGSQGIPYQYFQAVVFNDPDGEKGLIDRYSHMLDNAGVEALSADQSRRSNHW